MRGKGWGIVNGDSEVVLPRMKTGDRFHSVVQDPPASISFMAKKWDSDKGGRDNWIEWLKRIQEETLRLTVPGGWSLTWAIPRRSHWTAMAVEKAGWDVFDIIHSLFGSGMPKGFIKSKAHPGYGTGLKPVAEHWVLARKPLSERSTAANLERWLTGALRIDTCRVGTNAGWSYPNGRGGEGIWKYQSDEPTTMCQNLSTPIEATKGRYPPHLLLHHAPGCVLVGKQKVKAGKAYRKHGGKNFGSNKEKPPLEDMTYGDAEGNEEVPVFDCVSGCPVRVVDEQAGSTGSHGSRGGYSMGSGYKGLGVGGASTKKVGASKGNVSRFWPTFHYFPKASRKEKERGLEGLSEKDWREGTKQSTPCSGQIYEHVGRKGKPRANSHPTCKSVNLMRWLIRLTTPPGGLVLDPFCGSGTTGVAALEEGCRFIGVEEDEYYCEIAKRRVEAIDRGS